MHNIVISVYYQKYHNKNNPSYYKSCKNDWYYPNNFLVSQPIECVCSKTFSRWIKVKKFLIDRMEGPRNIFIYFIYYFLMLRLELWIFVVRGWKQDTVVYRGGGWTTASHRWTLCSQSLKSNHNQAQLQVKVKVQLEVK